MTVVGEAVLVTATAGDCRAVTVAVAVLEVRAWLLGDVAVATAMSSTLPWSRSDCVVT